MASTFVALLPTDLRHRRDTSVAKSPVEQVEVREFDGFGVAESVSYTHLTLPTIYSV